MEKFSIKKEISIEEETFNDYVKDLNLKPEDFKKEIFDIDAGEAYFAKWAKDNNISSTIYSLDPRQEMNLKEKGIIGIAEEIPIKDKFFDLIISNGAIPNIYLGGDNVNEKVKKSFSEMLRILKDKGEIRLSCVLMGRRYQSQMVLTDSIEEVLSKLKEKDNFDIQLTRLFDNDTYEYDENGNKKELLAPSFLIIIKKKY